MPTAKLSDLIITSAKPQKKSYALNDLETPGLQCVINPSGKKTFRLKTRSFAKKIGHFPIVKYAEAKKIALVWYAELIQGEKPGAKNHQEQKAPQKTVNHLLEEYFEFKKPTWGEGTFYKNHWIWRGVISPAFGNKDITEISDILINRFLFSLKDTPTHAKFSTDILRPAFKHGKKLGYPIPHLEYGEWHKYKRKKRTRHLTPADFPLFWETLSRVENSSLEKWGMGSIMCQIIKLLLLTGCRCGEILNLKWSEVYVEEGYFQLWKTKNDEARPIPLVSLHQEIFKKIPRFASIPYVFPSLNNQERPLSHATFYTFWANFMKETKLNENPDIEALNIHSLRHTYITVANRARISPWILQALVGHTSSNSVTGDYIHFDLDDLKIAAEEIVKRLTYGLKNFPSEVS